MRGFTAFPVLFFTLLVAAPVQAIEVSADTARTIKEFSGNVRILFGPKDKFDVTSDNTSRQGAVVVFSGSVIVRFQGGMAKAEEIAVTKLPDGTSILESSELSLEYFQGKSS